MIDLPSQSFAGWIIRWSIDPYEIKGRLACEQLATGMISTLQSATLLTEETQRGIISDSDGYLRSRQHHELSSTCVAVTLQAGGSQQLIAS